MNKNERINEIDVAGMLEDAQCQLADCQKQLDETQKEISRISHNIGMTAGLIEKVHAKLVTGGAIE